MRPHMRPLQRHGLRRLALLAPQAVTAGPELLRGVPVRAMLYMFPKTRG